MEELDLIQKVRKIEIKSKGLSNNIFAGQYHTAFKGRGMAFSEVREYQYGDSVRDIDWNVTARMDHPYVKVFEEERELTVMLLVDMSGSLDFGTSSQTQRELVTEIAATLAFAAIQNNDKVGLLFYTDHVEKFIPPQKGRKHILYLIRELLNFEPESRTTSLQAPLEFLTNAIKRRCTAFVLSDFVDNSNFQNALTISNQKHDVVAIQVYDKRMEELPNIGLVNMTDAETGMEMYVDTGSKSVRKRHNEAWNRQQARLKEMFNKSRVDSISIRTDQDFVKVLLGLFALRS
ncbi:MAG: DUF58 domain-containing protein [Bacteroidaceae bacterium]|nr:DUF58 domain-containing protein [Bacteroidaceae bacterium]